MGGAGSGRRPRPNHLKALEGAPECRLNRLEPVPAESPISPPCELPAEALAVWNRLAPDLIASRVLTAWDVDLFAVFCRSVALYQRYAETVEREGVKTARPYKGETISPAWRAMRASADEMARLGSRFGLTPADRAGLKVGDDGASRNGSARLLS